MAKRRNRERKVRRPDIGASPGTIVGRPDAPRTPIRVIHFDGERFDESFVDDVEACRPFLARPGVCWLDVDESPSTARLEALGKLLDLHPLAVADAANVPQRPKHEVYETFDFLVLRMAIRVDAVLRTEQVSLFLGDRWVLTIQERPGDCLEPVRARLRAGIGKIRRQGPDYLAYAIIDAIVDGYFPLAEAVMDRLEEIEDDVLRAADRGVLARLHETRRELLHFRRAVWPMREALSQLTREGIGRFTPSTRLFLRDCHDHAIQVLDLVETSREMAASLVELHLSMVGFKTNDVMKILTIFSTIFLPLTFIAGVYGMNFDTSKPGNMPELTWPYGYELSLAVMALSAGVMLFWFRRKGWLGETSRELTGQGDDVAEKRRA